MGILKDSEVSFSTSVLVFVNVLITIHDVSFVLEIIYKVQEETKSHSDRKPPGVGRGRGRGREEGAGGRQPKGIGHGVDYGGAKGMGGGRAKEGLQARLVATKVEDEAVVDTQILIAE